MKTEEPFGCLGTILKLLGIGPRANSKALPYQRRDWLLSAAERSFFGVLKQAVDPEFLLFAKIRLADLLFIPRGTEGRQAAFNRIQSKHIDFVICDRDTIRPLIAIELDDSSHSRPSRRSRDEFVESALTAAQLPLLRVPVKKQYDVNVLKESVQKLLDAEIKPASG